MAKAKQNLFYIIMKIFWMNRTWTDFTLILQDLHNFCSMLLKKLVANTLQKLFQHIVWVIYYVITVFFIYNINFFVTLIKYAQCFSSKRNRSLRTMIIQYEELIKYMESHSEFATKIPPWSKSSRNYHQSADLSCFFS